MLARLVTSLLLIAELSGPAHAQPQEKTQVMIVGTFHLSNPGRDMHDVHADDMLAPKRQEEIASIVSALSEFHPTEIDVEADADRVPQRYEAFVKGTLPPSRNEVVQLGFRLARLTGASVHGVDVDGDFPYEAVDTYGKSHGQGGLLASADAGIVKMVTEQQALLDSGSLARVLRYMNDPAVIHNDNTFYGAMLSIGRGAEQPGADLLAAWYKRNAYICANIVQFAKPGDRIVVIYGAGHLTRLRSCVNELPGFELVETNNYLPK